MNPRPHKSSLPKKVLKNILPPLFPKLYGKYRAYQLGRTDFKAWWKEFSAKNPALPADLSLMVSYFISSPAFSSSSKYWNYLNRLNIEQLAAGGYQNFKQTVAKNYFTFVGGGIDTPYAANLLAQASNSSWPSQEILKKHSHFTRDESLNYNVITCLLFDFVQKNDPANLLSQLEEPAEGNPPAIEFKGKFICQDTLNSVLEINSVLRGADLAKAKAVIEVGAGSGRTSYGILRLFPQLKYVIVDIPPALFVSQTYLSGQFKERKIRKFKPIQDAATFERELVEAQVIFLTPDQLKHLPKKFADVFLAVDCLHEMKREQVQIYFDEAERLARSLYFKCWNETLVPFDDVRHTEHDYPVKSTWTRKYHEHCRVPSTYFEAFYQF